MRAPPQLKRAQRRNQTGRGIESRIILFRHSWNSIPTILHIPGSFIYIPNGPYISAPYVAAIQRSEGRIRLNYLYTTIYVSFSRYEEMHSQSNGQSFRIRMQNSNSRLVIVVGLGENNKRSINLRNLCGKICGKSSVRTSEIK